MTFQENVSIIFCLLYVQSGHYNEYHLEHKINNYIILIKLIIFVIILFWILFVIILFSYERSENLI